MNIMSALSKESDCDFNIGCIGKDVKNYLKKKEKIVWKEDVQRLYDYFFDLEYKKFRFVYTMQVDENDHMKIFF